MAEALKLIGQAIIKHQLVSGERADISQIAQCCIGHHQPYHAHHRSQNAGLLTIRGLFSFRCRIKQTAKTGRLR